MDRLEANAVCIVATLTTMLMAGTIPSVSADCTDPGHPKNGYRNVTRKGSGFPVGTVISFSCNPDYTLVGAKKIICEGKDNKYSWNGKVPFCKWPSAGCPLPPPNVTHANIVQPEQVGSKKGSKAYYRCVDGYTSEQKEPYKLCDKDPMTQGFIWSGNFTCKKKTCGNPPARIGDGTYSLSVRGSHIDATYHCSPTFLLKVEVPSKPATLKYNYKISCDQTGYWPRVTLTCVKTCRSLSEPKHGKISFSTSGPLGANYTQGTTATFVCDPLYRLVGSSSRTCLHSGYWSNVEPHCVLYACGNPGNLSNGRGTFNSTPDVHPIWTTVTYSCYSGYQLIGVKTRQCRPNGQWSGERNPICKKSHITCESPTKILHGQFAPVKPTYKLNVRVHYTCDPEYFLWGAASLQCTALPGDLKGLWQGCDDLSDYSCHSEVGTECLPPSVYEDKCKESGGQVTIRRVPLCIKGTDATPTANLISIKSGDNELDKMTIVVATAGSTLGALVVLLTALVCFRRFHQSRRFRHSAFRSRRYSDDDRIAIIAAYTGDVHFILPSYDEAISQVQSSPPSFESVVENRQEGGNQIASNANSQSVDTNERNIAANGTDGASEVSGPAASVPERGVSTGEERLINIVNSPLANSSRGGSETAGINHSDNILLPVEERIADYDFSPNRCSENLPSSSSEDDLTSSQTQPLLGNRKRGVMV